MATNKVITVTTPSVVTNDTLASYNAYSDQDGSLGSLSVAEAAAGKTFALSDGVVHSVTVKPVGTSNGEFSAVISNAVSVDLSGGGGAINPIGDNHNASFSRSGNIYTDLNGTTSYVAVGSSVSGYSGDFYFTIDSLDVANDATAAIGLDVLNNTTSSTNDFDYYSSLRNVAGDPIQAFTNGSPVTTDATVACVFSAGTTLGFRRVSGVITLEHNGSVVHTFSGTNTNTLYLKIAQKASRKVTNPLVLA